MVLGDALADLEGGRQVEVNQPLGIRLTQPLLLCIGYEPVVHDFVRHQVFQTNGQHPRVYSGASAPKSASAWGSATGAVG
jgi:hypothetical protein